MGQITINTQRIFAACGATWVPERIDRVGPWDIRTGGGGGARVSAATAAADLDSDALAVAEAAMRERGQAPLFMVRGGEDALDAVLAQAGYALCDPVVVLAARTADIAPPNPMSAIPSVAPLARAREIWAAGGIGPARLAVMARVSRPKTYLVGRLKDRPAGAAFVGVDGEIAVLHALEVLPEKRRGGVGQALTAQAAAWSASQGATTLCLMVTRANTPALAMYAGMGFSEMASYHYRRKE